MSERVEIGRALEGELQGRAGNPTGANQHGGGTVENFPELPKGDTRALAAKAAGFGNGTSPDFSDIFHTDQQKRPLC